MVWIIVGIVSVLVWLGFRDYFVIQPNTDGMFYDAFFMLD